MDWIASLALGLGLGVPIALAIAYTAARRASAATSVARTTYDAATELCNSFAQFTEMLREVVPLLTEAHVKAAKVRVGWTKPKLKAVADEESPVFDLWLRDEGGAKDENVQNRVEWALGRLRGYEPDQGSVEKAEAILAADAPGYAALQRRRIDAERMPLAKK